ncbi:uncharacterized protein HaLaN_00135, partial [Haematococcus lacustris]
MPSSAAMQPVTTNRTVYEEQYASIFVVTQVQVFDTCLVIPENQSQNMKEPRGLLHPRAYLVMFYRRDLFSALGLAPPETWEQLLQLATNTSLWAQAAV